MSIGEIKIIKQLTQQLVDAAGGVVNAAKVAKTTPSMISQWQNHDNDKIINAFAILRLTKLTQNDSLINFLLSGSGAEDRRNVVKKAQGFDLMMQLSKLHKEGSDFTSVTAEALADNEVTELEARQMLKEALEFRAEIENTINLVVSLGGVEISSIMEDPT